MSTAARAPGPEEKAWPAWTSQPINHPPAHGRRCGRPSPRPPFRFCLWPHCSPPPRGPTTRRCPRCPPPATSSGRWIDPGPEEGLRDLAGVLTAAESRALRQKVRDLRDDTGVPVYVLLLDPIPPAASGTAAALNAPLAGFLQRLFVRLGDRHPLLQDTDWSAGVVLAVAPAAKRARVGFGPGWNDQTRRVAGGLAAAYGAAAFRRGDYGRGLERLLDATGALVRGQPLPPRPGAFWWRSLWVLGGVAAALALAGVWHRPTGRRTLHGLRVLLALPHAALDLAAGRRPMPPPLYPPRPPVRPAQACVGKNAFCLPLSVHARSTPFLLRFGARPVRLPPPAVGPRTRHRHRDVVRPRRPASRPSTRRSPTRCPRPVPIGAWCAPHASPRATARPTSSRRPAGIAATLTALTLLPAADPVGESWDGLSPAVRIALTAAVGGLGTLVGAAVAGRWSALRTLVTPPNARGDAAASGARRAFAQDCPPAGTSALDVSDAGNVADAPARILVHAALAERRVTVLADLAWHQRLGPDGLDTLCREAAEPLADDHDDPLVALAQGVRAAADHLARQLASEGAHSG